MKRPWIAFFSQTGTEIQQLCNKLGTYPDLIVTNQHQQDKINKDLLTVATSRAILLNMRNWEVLPVKPSLKDYVDALAGYEDKDPLITLHGYLRIMPKEICNKYEMYNLHPGLINKFPELKGYNPQERAFINGYKSAGCVIHKVTPGVDEGDIMSCDEIDIDSLTLPQVYSALHACAQTLWQSFLSPHVAA